MRRAVAYAASTILIVSMALVACSDTASQLPQQMVGYWYSEYIDPGTREQFRSIAERRADGVLVIRFRKYRDGHMVSEHEEAGRWFVADGLYKNHIKVVDGLISENFITYAIVSRSDNAFVYKHEPTGLTFNGKRVEPTYRLP